jgi:hypothetical protein
MSRPAHHTGSRPAGDPPATRTGPGNPTLATAAGGMLNRAAVT